MNPIILQIAITLLQLSIPAVLFLVLLVYQDWRFHSRWRDRITSFVSGVFRKLLGKKPR
jgi:uncharacterized protein YggT (Ycf19 family)